MAIDAQLPLQWMDYECVFTITNAALAKILVDAAPPRILAAITGELGAPQRVLTGGQRVVDGGFASNDGTARDIYIYTGKQMSLYADMGAPTITGSNTINRTGGGSFITEGWQIGDAAMLFGATNTANNGLLLVITGVSASALTVNGVPLTNETLPVGARVIRVARRTTKNLPLNAGNTNGAPAIPLFGGTQDPAALPPPDTGMSLSKDGVIICAMTAAISALPAQVFCHAKAALY